MRIISGSLKGRIIQRPNNIRPTQDKVRKALFDILGDIKGLSFLDLYAGSGGVGLEALSQGAGRVMFVEMDRICVTRIRDSLAAVEVAIERLDGSAGYRVIELDVSRALEQLNKIGERFDIVFLDPPYHKGVVPRGRKDKIARHSGSKAIGDESLTKKTLKILSRYDILSVSGWIICQHFKKDILPEVTDGLRLVRQVVYGDTVLSFYKRES